MFLQVRSSRDWDVDVVLKLLCTQMLLGTTRNQEWESAYLLCLLESTESSERLGERPSPDLGTALYNEGLPLLILGEGACANCFIVMVVMNAFILLRVNQGLTFCRKGYPGKKAHWLNTQGLSRYLISMEKELGFYAA